jgi:hypothetical protein
MRGEVDEAFDGFCVSFYTHRRRRTGAMAGAVTSAVTSATMTSSASSCPSSSICMVCSRIWLVSCTVLVLLDSESAWLVRIVCFDDDFADDLMQLHQKNTCCRGMQVVQVASDRTAKKKMAHLACMQGAHLAIISPCVSTGTP